MSRPVHERLRDLEGEVRDLRYPPAAEVRARGRSRGRRQRAAMVTAGVAVVAATVGVTVAWPPRQGTTPVASTPVGPALSCDLSLPDSPAAVRLRVVDGGAPSVIQALVATQLRERRFTVLDGPAGSSPVEVATVVYGPAAVGDAVLVRATLRGEVGMRFDPARADDVVDVILAPSFTRLATSTEINQNLVAAGPPTAPPGC
jgi:hypothetical protein